MALVAATLVILTNSSLAQNAGVVTAVNISARATVSSGANVLIGGFIVTGTAPKSVLLRALGPSLSVGGTILVGILQDPVLELYDRSGNLIAINDDWIYSPQADLIGRTLPPPDPRESALIMTLEPGSYTAIVRSYNSGLTGVALVELYDLGSANLAQVANLSTRGDVQLGDAAMIGGFIINGNTDATVLVRALGPELTARDVPGALQDTTLELRDSNGALLAFNDDWITDEEAQILFSDEAPADPRESALVRTLAPGPYTVVVRGKNETVGIALLEVYVLQ